MILFLCPGKGAPGGGEAGMGNRHSLAGFVGTLLPLRVNGPVVVLGLSRGATGPNLGFKRMASRQHCSTT